MGQSIIRIPEDAPSISQGNAMAGPGSVLVVAPGTYNESVNLGAGVSLHGAGPGLTIIDSFGTSPNPLTLSIDSQSVGCDTVVSGVTITGGSYGTWVDGGSLVMVDCEITGNGPYPNGGSVLGGGGMHFDFGSARLIRTRIYGNNSSAYGGGLDIRGLNGTFELVDCEVSGNSAALGGGGIAFTGEAYLNLDNCLVTGNTTLGNGGGMYFGVDFTLPFTHDWSRCTIADNTAGGTGGGIYLVDGTCTLNHSIIWGNQPNGVAEMPCVSCAPTLSVTWSDLQSPRAGTGNISTNPLFTNPVAGDFSLMALSPCLNSGNALEQDPDGSRRDMGRVGFFPAATGAGISNMGIIPPGIFSCSNTQLNIDNAAPRPTQREDLNANAPFTVNLESFIPSSGSGTTPFMLMMYLGIPTQTDAFFADGLGSLAFTPPLLLPQATDRYTLVDSLFPSFTTPLLPPAEAPWSLTLPVGLPAMQLTIQAVMLGGPIPGYGPAFLRKSDAIILNLR